MDNIFRRKTTGRTTGQRLLIVSLLLFITQEMNGQQNGAPTTESSYNTIDLPEIGGRFFVDLKDLKVSRTEQVQHMNASFGLSDSYHFLVIEEREDKLGYIHTAYQQYYLGLPIEEGMLLFHVRAGTMTAINGNLGKVPEGFSVQPGIDQARAIEIAMEELGFEKSSNHSEASLVISRNIEEEAYVLAYKIYLEGFNKSGIYYKMNVFVDAKSGKVIHKLSLMSHAVVQGMAHTLYSGIREITMDSYEGGFRLRDEVRNITTLNFDQAEVTSRGVKNLMEYTNEDATWGEVLALDSVVLLTAGDSNLIKNRVWIPFVSIGDPRVQGFPIQGPIYDYSRPTAVPFSFSGIGLSMLAPPYKVNISNYNTINGLNSGKALFYIDSTAIVEGTHNWSDSLGNEGHYAIRRMANPALDAHWGMARTYDYYKAVFGRSGYNGKNAPITNMINAAYVYAGSQSNAASLGGGSGVMVFGLGDRYKMNAVVCLDVLGHEYTHMVIDANGHGGLVYQGESGALNESFADIFGTCIEHFAKDSGANWKLGEDAFLRAPWMFRSVAEPKSTLNPDTYNGQYWIDPAQVKNDYGGVHSNSGVQNKWFYLLCEGGSGTNDKKDVYQVAGIGMEKAQQIAYRNLTTYLTPYAKYADAYHGSLKAAEDFYGKSGAEYKAVKDAWFAVGISDATGLKNVASVASPLKVYPNPASDQVNIAWSLKESAIVTVVIRDVNSRVVMRQDYGHRNAGAINTQAAIGHLNQGVYMVEVSAGTQMSTGKMLIQR